MRRAAAIALVLALAVGCAPRAHLATIINDYEKEACENFFPQGRWEAVHTIQARMGPGAAVSVLGAVVVDRTRRGVQALIVTVEGMVLLSAQRDSSGLVVERALPPFDAHGLAAGLLDDVSLVFLPPGGPLAESGRDAQGRGVCRFQANDALVEVITDPEGRPARLRLIGPEGVIKREVEFFPPFTRKLAAKMVIRAPGVRGYQLTLELERVEGLDYLLSIRFDPPGSSSGLPTCGLTQTSILSPPKILFSTTIKQLRLPL